MIPLPPGNPPGLSIPRRVLVIRHGALGDFFQAFSAFAAIRQAFPDDHITLLTATPYREVAALSPWFDAIATDDRPPVTDWRHWLAIRRLLRGMDQVFDLQNSQRTARYFRLARAGTLWSGQHERASLPHHNPQARQMHTLTRQESQLRAAGVPPVRREVPAFLTGHGPRLAGPYVCLVPGAAPHRPAKRWPAAHFATLAGAVARWGYCPVIIGSKADAALARHIRTQTPDAMDLTGRTDLPALAGLLHRARFCIGNDTGPMHMAATMDCPTLTLFSAESDPRRCAPLGLTPGHARSLSSPTLEQLAPGRVITLMQDWGLPLMQDHETGP